MHHLFVHVAVTAAIGAASARPLDDLFARWVNTQQQTQSLVVEFHQQITDPVARSTVNSIGSFRLLRTDNGDVFASYEVIEAIPRVGPLRRFSGLLSGGKIYQLEHDRLTAIRYEPDSGEFWQFLETWFNPFVVLLDRRRAEAKYTMEVQKQDEWYDYLLLKPKREKWWGWSAIPIVQGDVALMRKNTETIPKGMPRQLRYVHAGQIVNFDISEWRMNHAVGPKLEEFVKPEDRPGWQVEDWTLLLKKIQDMK